MNVQEQKQEQMQAPRLIRALLRQPIDRTPVWIMRQAGRYLPEYRKIRSQAKDFLTLCKTPELACQVTLQPLERFPLDAAIIFSDILTVPDALGLGLYFEEGEGPKFSHPIRTQSDIEKLPNIDAEKELSYVMDAIRLTVKELDGRNGRTPLIGFAGSPWTVATYMVEGQSSKTFNQIKRLIYQEPALAHQLLAHLTKISIDYLNAQIKAGCDCIMIFDSWGGLLSPKEYLLFSLYYMQEIVQKLSRHVSGKEIPIILFTKGGAPYLEELSLSGCDCVGLDWTIHLDKARQLVQDRVALQGNLDPAVLYAEPAVIQAEVSKVLAQYGRGAGHIFNLGHGIYPDVPVEHVASMIEAVQTLSPQYHVQ